MVYLIGSGHLPRKQQNETKNIQGFAFDTTYQITIYQGGTKKTLQKCVSECSSYENVISRTKETRSEERRVGKEGFRLCRSRWSPYH